MESPLTTTTRDRVLFDNASPNSPTVPQLLRTVLNSFQIHPSLQNSQNQYLYSESDRTQKSLGTWAITRPPPHLPEEAPQLPAFASIAPPTSAHARRNNRVELVDILSLFPTKALLESVAEDTKRRPARKKRDSAGWKNKDDDPMDILPEIIEELCLFSS